MAAAPPILPIEYIRIHDLPPASALPEELRGQILFSRVNFVHSKAPGAGGTSASGVSTGSSVPASQGPSGKANGAASKGGGKGTGGGFNFSKALKGALDGAGTSVTSRGDGKLEDGKDFAVSDAPGGRAKVVHLTPEALAAGNAERTLAELDRLQQLAGARQPSGAASTPSSTGPLLRSTQAANAASLAAAAHILYDISDDPPAPAATSAAATSATAVLPGGSGAATGAVGPRVPEYSLRELPPQEEAEGRTGRPGSGRLEVCVTMPDVTAPGEVEVWLDGGGVLQVLVPGKYSLKLELPCPVVDDTSQAKWSKAKRRLTLTLTKAKGR